MGIYLNPGYDLFLDAIRSEIYVDKTEMISYLNSLIGTKQKYLAVSRPRRFGKTMAVDMICAYYDCSVDSRSYFERLKIAEKEAYMAPIHLLDPDGEKREIRWDLYLNQFNVLRLNMIDFMKSWSCVEEMLSYLQDEVTAELMDAYPEIRYGRVVDLETVMTKIYGKTREQFVIVIDEWDCLFRRFKEDKEGQTKYLDFLRNWLKDKPYVALAYMTGILPIKKYGEHSALNMFTEYSMISPKQLAEYAGFTEEEVRQECEMRGIRFEGLKDWYDGYRISNLPSEELLEEKRQIDPEEYREYEIYSPLSVVSALLTRKLENYWNESETSDALKEYIRRNYDGLKEDVILLMQGKRLPVNVRNYQNDMTTFRSKDDIFTLLIHLGYLGYDSEKKEIFIPNKEIRDVFDETTGDEEWTYLFQAIKNSQRLLEATWAGDAERVAQLVEDAHLRADSRSYHSEAALSYAVRLAYFSAEEYYTLIPEMPAGKGYADLVYLPSPKYPNKPALLVELKWNRDADTAISQIHRQRYPESLEKYRGNLILVGISYDKEVRNDSKNFKHHSCVIEKV